MRKLILLLTLVCLAACHSSPPTPGPYPQLVLYGGTVYIQQDGQVTSAIALQNGRVLAVGTDAEMRALASSNTREIDLAGRAVYPGFADAHAHLVGIGMAARRLDLMGTESFADVVALAAQRTEELGMGEWLTGRGWDQNDWELQEFPTHDALSAAIPDRPVVLSRVDGHALLANRAAMKVAGVDRNTQDPDGGRILRDANGEPTGVFVDRAQALIRRVMPGMSPQAIRMAVLAATETLHQQGITSMHDAGTGQEVLYVLESLSRDGLLQLRLHEMLDGSDEALLEEHFASGAVHDFEAHGTLQVRAVKLYADGALGSRGAALLEPYEDDHANHGLAITSTEEMLALCKRALDAGFQVCTHAIGDRGVRQTLDAYSQAFEERGSEQDGPRFRVEHAQVVSDQDFARFGAMGVIPSMQAQHQTSDMPWAEDRVGPDRIRGAYAWRRFLDQGCILPGGSDAPVERLDVVAQFVAAVTRATTAGEPQGGWYPGQAMTRQEALNMLTIWPAQASFREDDLGRLAPGYRADLTIFEGDLMTVPLDELAECRPSMTIFAGEVVWQ